MKTYIVTGASRGIGKDAAIRLLELGNRVVLVARNEELLRTIEKIYPDLALVEVLDVTDYSKVDEMFRKYQGRGIKFDGLVYCAGVTMDCPVKSLDMDELKTTFDINFFGYVNMAKYFTYKKFTEQGASVVAISSQAALDCSKGLSGYVTSKTAINSFTKVMAKEMASKGIRVNAIAPAVVNTDLYKQAVEQIEDYEQTVVQSQLLGVISVERVTDLIEYLLSDKSEFMTGEIIRLSGGLD